MFQGENRKKKGRKINETERQKERVSYNDVITHRVDTAA
jgi:hypothetical protein